MSRSSLSSLWRMPVLLSGIGIIFIVDTLTHYEVAVAVFYAVLILAAGRRFSQTGVYKLACLCAVLTVLSFALTLKGNFGTGLINTGISLTAIALIVYVKIKMEAARQAAQFAQQQLARLGRIQSLESLSTSIAHELNQPLAAMVTSAQTCQRWLRQTPPNVSKALDTAQRMVQDADRASAIIDRVRSLTRGESIQRQAFDINHALAEVLDLLSLDIQGQRVRVLLRLGEHLPQALGDRVYVQQVVTNLVSNAIEAMVQTPAAKRVLVLGTELHGQQLMISVMDSGPGLRTDQLEHVFDAFWTTKTTGVGIGLSISRSMIEANGGRIWAESVKGGGAVFRLTIPIAEQEPT